MTVLRGPAEADNFRVQVGRYGDRWYTDLLPPCPVAPEVCYRDFPSISTVKKAAGSDWSYVAMRRCADVDDVEALRIAKLTANERYDAYKAANARGLSIAAGRGTIIHWWAEDLLNGRPMRTVLPGRNIEQASIDEAEQYRAAVVDFFDTYQPELFAAEYVTIHRDLNGVGYGGTPDAIIIIDGRRFGVDWKSRGVDSAHGAYPEEGAQIAAGARAQYMIVADSDGGAVRAPLPELDGGLVVSIKPDGCRVYPVDLDAAFEHYAAMHAWWVARRDERRPIGRQWPVRSKSAAPVTAPHGAVERQSPEVAASTSGDTFEQRCARFATELRALDQQWVTLLRERWPVGVPNPARILNGDATWTVQHVADITAVLDAIGAPFLNDPRVVREITPVASVAAEACCPLCGSNDVEDAA